MNLDQFIAARKRSTQYGNADNATDQQAKNVLAAVNSGLDRICTNWLWDWLYEPVNITLVPGTTDYTLPANIRKIINIYAGNHASLRNIGLKEYHQYAYADPAEGESSEGPAAWYMYIGRDAATGARKIRIGNIPGASGALVGFGKLKFTRFVEADLGTAKSLLPLPEEGERVLEQFVLSDIYRLQDKKDLIFPQLAQAESALKAWRGEEATEPSKTATTKLPGYLRGKMAARRAGYVV